jgi:hypothetical protein
MPTSTKFGVDAISAFVLQVSCPTLATPRILRNRILNPGQAINQASVLRQQVNLRPLHRL